MSNPTSRALQTQGCLVVVVASLELWRRAVLICVVLVRVLASDVMLIVHVGSVFFGLVVSTLAVPLVHAYIQLSQKDPQICSKTLHTLGLSELVNFTADETHEELLSEGVVHNFACWVVRFMASQR